MNASTLTQPKPRTPRLPRLTKSADRRGAIVALLAALMVVLLGFVAFAVDTGLIATMQTNLQNAADAAAIAASQEIVASIQDAGEGDTQIDFNSIAVANAREMAVQVALANGFTIDGNSDITFGRRTYNPSNGTWSITWNSEPFNVVKVNVARDNVDLAAPDGRVPLAFGWAVGVSSVEVSASAAAFLESRDIVVTLDLSASMNDDSTIASFGSMGQANVESNLDDIWNSLVTANPTFKGTTKAKFPSSGFGSINSYYGTYHSSTNADTVFNALNLGATDSNGALLYPFPQAGKNGSGVQNGIPNAATSKTRWKAYIDYVKNHSNTTYKKRYGYRTLMDYLLTQKPRNVDSEDLWRTPHYPFQALKDANSLFCDYLEQLDFGDECGLSVYATTALVESSTSEDGANVNISSDLITSDHAAVKTIAKQRQAGHYNTTTNIGDGILKGRQLLENHARFGARRTILLVTDGLANVRPAGWSLPSSFCWCDWTDWDGDGTADYTNNDANCQYAFWEATEAIKLGITIHTITVGVGADDPFMEAIAKASGGIWIDVPGGTTVAEMEQQLQDAFRQIAARLPPPKLVGDL